MSCNVINAIKNFSKIFKSKYLTQIQGKNISVITNQLHAAVVSLDEVGAVPDETYGEILGLQLVLLLTTWMGVNYLLPRVNLVIPFYPKVKNQFTDRFFTVELNIQLCRLDAKVTHSGKFENSPQKNAPKNYRLPLSTQ